MIPAFLAIKHADVPAQYFSLTWIGFATATSTLITVPILTQQLVQKLQARNLDTISLKMIFTLYAGNHLEHPTGTVAKYEADWWKTGVPPWDGNILNMDNLQACLTCHRKQTNASPPAANFQFLPVDMNPSAASSISDAPSSTSSTIPSTHVTTSSNQLNDICLGYRCAALHSLEELCKVQFQLHTKAAIQEHLCDLSMWHAQAFHQLYEAAMSKEAIVTLKQVDEAQCPTVASSMCVLQSQQSSALAPRRSMTRAQLAKIICHNAEVRLHQLQEHPSLKWTWGMDIDHDDIRNMVHAECWVYGEHQYHTGYNKSLPEGHGWGQYSAYESSSNINDASVIASNTITIASSSSNAEDIRQALGGTLDDSHDEQSLLSLASNGFHQMLGGDMSSSSAACDAHPPSLASASNELTPLPSSSTDDLQALEGFNDSDNSSRLASGSSSSGLAVADHLALLSGNLLDDDFLIPATQTMQGCRWTADDFEGYPDPDDCV